MIKEKIKIGSMELNNRIIMPPIATYKSTVTGEVTQEILDYYGERAKGGHIGMIMTEHSYIMLSGKANIRQMSISKDSDVEGLKRLTDVIHQDGTKVMAQLNHAGSAAPSEVTGLKAVSASAVVLPCIPVMGDNVEPSELTISQIEEIVQAFAKAAGRAKTAGYDGVEIHSAHGYLLNQFYSPLTNKREDEYGGNRKNRIRIHLAVIKAVRDEVGSAFPISVRLGGCDYMEGGSKIEDAVFATKAFENAGIDMISISGGMCRYTRKGHNEPGYFQDMSSAVKDAVSIPVLLTGGVNTAHEAEQLLQKNKADLIGVGRALLKNPHWTIDQ
ncbi:MAG: NADH:flavin oxidoreductase [Lachnospiraceae bacterium]|nr:NADH:flavin oxidoreductase [Lachnospiraceae bacterium]